MVNGTDLVVFLAQKVRALSSLISPHTDRARETLRGGKAAASLAKPLLGKRGEIAPLSAPPHTRLYSKEEALDKTRILAPSDYLYHFSFPSYGRLKSKTNFSNVFLRPCSLIPLMHCS